MTDLKNAMRLVRSGYPLTLAGAARVVRDMYAEARELEREARGLEKDEALAELSRVYELRAWARRSESYHHLNAAVRIAEALRDDEAPAAAGARPSHHEETK